MEKMHKLAAILLINILFLSCKKENETAHPYDVDGEIQPYIDRFKEEASKRGHNINFEDGLTARFVDNLNGPAGHTTTTPPYVMEFDRNIWDKYDDVSRENIVFHELGHSFLQRKHKNDIFPNGEWKSLMRGSPFTGEKKIVNLYTNTLRREYYIDELFNENVAAPQWISINDNYNSISQQQKQIIFTDSFSNNNNSWITANTSNYQFSIQNGYYVLVSKTDQGWSSASVAFPIPNMIDFEIEALIKNQPEDADKENQSSGLQFGGFASNSNLRRYIYISKNEGIGVGNFYRYGFDCTLLPTNVSFEGFNKITIRKKAGYYYYYINEQFIYYDQFDPFENEFKIAFRTGSYTTTYIDQITYSQIL